MGRVYLAWWSQFLVTTQYVVCKRCGFGLVVCAQKGYIIKVVPDTLVSIRVSGHDETHCLESLGVIFIVSIHVVFT